MLSDWKVYLHRNKTNGKVYIGITSNSLKQRWKKGHGYKGCCNFEKAIKRYGWNGFNHQVLFTGLTKQEAEELEIKLIEKYQSFNKKFGYNMTMGGSDNIPIKEVRKKQSKQRLHLIKNKPELLQKAINAASIKNSKPVKCIETGELYKSASEATRLTNINRCSIAKCCQKKVNTAGGFHWQYCSGGN